MRLSILASAILLCNACLLPGQFEQEPDGAHTDLYFPHLADGGPASASWQTAITFLNSHANSAVNVAVTFFADDGSPLKLDFGSGAASTFTAQIPPGGTVTLRSTAASPTTVTGWAFAAADLPLQGTLQFRLTTNGVPRSEVSALAAPLGVSYVSPANYNTGLALANIYTSPLSLKIAITDTKGNPAGSTSVTIPPTGHQSYNVFSLFPALPATFEGSLKVTAAASTYFAGWTLSVDPSGVFSSYPPGAQAWPASHVDRIRDVYFKNLNAAQFLASGLGLGLKFDQQSVPLKILSDSVLNAYALSADNSVNIEIAVAELISDSPSELAFAVAHEMGHTVQYRTGKKFFSQNTEYDADQWGMLISLVAGYDPYAAAGTLAKLSMATNSAGLVAQLFDNISGDLHGSFNNRIDLVYQNLQAVCTAAGTFCPLYKANFHPHFPSTTPLAVPPQRETK